MLGFHLDVPVNECIRRAEGRQDHPTLNGKDVVQVILRWSILIFYVAMTAMAKGSSGTKACACGPGVSHAP